MSGNKESSANVDIVSATITKDVGQAADVRMAGRYTAECRGPREGLRELYITLRDNLAKIERGMAGNLFTRLLTAVLVFFAFGFRLPDRAIASIKETMEDMVELKWADSIENLVVTVGRNHVLDTVLAGSSYTAACYVGLLSGTPTPAAADTMASHAGWTEVGGTNAPQYTAPRKTPSWSASSNGSKATSANMSFAFTSSGTVGGCFLVLGSGASSTIDNTGGVLYSAGAFTGGNKAVQNGDTLQVSYTATATAS